MLKAVKKNEERNEIRSAVLAKEENNSACHYSNWQAGFHTWCCLCVAMIRGTRTLPLHFVTRPRREEEVLLGSPH